MAYIDFNHFCKMGSIHNYLNYKSLSNHLQIFLHHTTIANTVLYNCILTLKVREIERKRERERERERWCVRETEGREVVWIKTKKHSVETKYKILSGIIYFELISRFF